MDVGTAVGIALAPSLGVAIWKLIHWPGRKLSDIAWKRLPEGRLRHYLLRESDPFAAVPPTRRRSAQAQRARRPHRLP